MTPVNVGKIFFSLLMLTGATASAFPEMVRHGYPNCTACHVSPSGGGVLTDYGRGLSKEKLATWSREGEERFFYILHPPDWLNSGGDLRFINVEKSTTSGATSQWIPMQRDLEAAVTVGKWTAAATLGYRDPIPPETDNLISRRHYLMYHPADEYSIRAGRFFPAFGIYIPEHATVIRRGFVWDESMETYNIEGSYLGEKYNLQLTGIFGRPDFPDLYRESGGAVTGAYNLGDTHKIGLSYYYGSSALFSHHIFGPYGIFGFTPRFYLLSQIDGIRTYASTNVNPQFGMADYQKLGYEIFQGFHVFAIQEFEQTDFQDNGTRIDAFSLGAQWFPRPHLDFQAFWQKKYYAQVSPPADIYVLYLHFYP